MKIYNSITLYSRNDIYICREMLSNGMRVAVYRRGDLIRIETGDAWDLDNLIDFAKKYKAKVS